MLVAATVTALTPALAALQPCPAAQAARAPRTPPAQRAAAGHANEAPPATSARRATAARRAALARSAHTLARIVRRSASSSGRGRPAGVVRIRCCGHRTLAVYYRARPRPGRPWHGTYELRLRSRGRFLESVGVAFFPTGAKWTYGSRTSSEGPRYELTITSPRRARGWRVNVSDSYFACPPKTSAAAQCDGFSDALALGERQLGPRRLRRLLGQALGLVGKARRRVPASGADVTAAGEAAGTARVAQPAGADHPSAPDQSG